LRVFFYIVQIQNCISSALSIIYSELFPSFVFLCILCRTLFTKTNFTHIIEFGFRACLLGWSMVGWIETGFPVSESLGAWLVAAELEIETGFPVSELGSLAGRSSPSFCK
jgi:hypothetical protein